ncbi:SipW-dependent-type signal peptide-containing protein [Nesterenkonia halotolerans]|uniref:Ribosomally synthesized peptide with SipW-like signal peptide n=1 Tax=Nesterenkonia halotolerans TaxID=225325 RepID=A0ABR9J6V8_9MICC|nr:SipW-dependent-type signal peptide-containing protein [Nesterenkonia halotolerans]MBE1514708.1 putative ribosomally synthesized peptide with SipW-like signal peptide [Nesterenkonia halotolerans]
MQNRSRRLRALLAAGLVLGIGASTTLAAWNDNEYAQGSITAASFALESNGGDSSGFSATTTETPKSLVYDSNKDAMFPGRHTYALFQVRTAAGSVPGSVQFQGAAQTTGAADQYRYAVRHISGTTCNADVFSQSSGTGVVPASSPLGTSSTTSQTLEANAGNTVNYCLRLTLRTDAPNSAQGTTVNPLWIVQGTSVSG